MPAYVPVIVDNATPQLIIRGAGGVTYEQILNSLGDFNYLVEALYMQANSMQQILQNLGFNKFDATGTQDTQQIVISPDPYQKIPAINIDLKGKRIVLDGRSNFFFDILPGESMTFIFSVDQVDVREQLEKFSKSKAVQNCIKD